MALAIAEEVPQDEPEFAAFDRQVGEAMGLHNAATAGLVAVVTRCIAGRWWEMQETHSPEHWCKVRLGVSRSTAARLVRCARGLEAFPRVAAAFAAGQLSVDHVAVIVALANPVYDQALAESGPTWDVPRMRRIIANFSIPKAAPEAEPTAADGDDEAAEPAPVEVFHAGWVDGNRYRGQFDLGADLGALAEKALGVARGDLFTARTGVDADDDDRAAQPATVSSVDAFGRLLHAALDGLDPESSRTRRPGERTQVIVQVDADHPERSRIHLGPLLPASMRRQLTCDADLRLAIARHGTTIALGRRRRTVDPLLRLVIEDRDQGCRVQGCDRRRFLHVHHLVHWEAGGPTDPDNLCCLCPDHHRMVHDGRIRLTGNPQTTDGLLTLDRRGKPLPQPGPRPPTQPLPPAPSRYAGTHWGERAHYN